jgi:hypothetical protein
MLRLSPIARWILLPVLVFVAFVLIGVSTGAMADSMHLWREPIVGFFAAFTVVIIAYVYAPSYRLQVSGATYICGAAVAYLLLRHAYYPEGYEHPYQETLLPLVVTSIGGAVGFVSLVFYHLKRESGRQVRLHNL